MSQNVVSHERGWHGTLGLCFCWLSQQFGIPLGSRCRQSDYLEQMHHTALSSLSLLHVPFGWSVTQDVKAWSSWCFHARPQRTLQGTPWSGQEYFNYQGRESWTSVKGLAKVRLVRGRPGRAPASGPSAASSPQALMTFFMCH